MFFFDPLYLVLALPALLLAFYAQFKVRRQRRMNRQRLWICCVLTALILLAGWSSYSIPPSVYADEKDYQVFLPLINMKEATFAPTPTPQPTSTPEPPALYGISYVDESDLPELVTLNIKLVTWRTEPSSQAALAFLDLAESYGLRVIIRMNGSGDWGWDGNRFDLSVLADFEPVIGGHPALFAVYGLHEPWERFDADQLRMFYSQWQAVAPSLPVWHDMGYLSPEFTDGMCDVCGISAYPHAWDQSGNPINNYSTNTRQKILAAQTYAPTDPDAILCASLQTFGRDFEGQSGLRMPTADEMRQNASIVFGRFQLTCGLWYPYHHSGYDHTLDDPEFSEHRQVVAETYTLYFAS